MKQMLRKSYAWLVAFVAMFAMSVSAGAVNFGEKNLTHNVYALNGTYDVLLSTLQGAGMPGAVKNASGIKLVDSSGTEVTGASVSASIVSSFTLRLVVSGVADDAASGVYKITVPAAALCLEDANMTTNDAFEVTITFTNPNAGGSSKPLFPVEETGYLVQNIKSGLFLHPTAGGIALSGSPELLYFTYDDDHEAFVIDGLSEYWTVEKVAEGKYSLRCENGLLGVDEDNHVTYNSSASDDHFLFSIAEPTYGVEAAVAAEKDGLYYGTYYADYAWYVPLGCKAYAASAVSDGYVTLTELASSAVESYTAVILESEESISTLPIMKAGSGSVPAVNYLRGSLAYMPVGNGSNYYYYKLCYDDNGENYGFYWDNAEGTSLVANPYKAYLRIPVASASNGLKIRFADDVTGISAVAAPQTGTLYNLQGQRVNAAKAGVYVKNGRKFIVK